MADSAVANVVSNPLVMGLSIPIGVVAYYILGGYRKASDLMGILNNVVLPLGFGYAGMYLAAVYLGINQPLMASAVGGLAAWAYYQMVEASLISKVESSL